MRSFFKAIAAVALLGLSACAGSVTSDVARFHTLAKPAGETIAFDAMDPAKKDSLEFHQYAGLIQDRLVQLGYRVAPAGAKPDLLVKVDYRVDDGKVQVRSYPDPTPGPYWGHGYWGPWGPYGGPWGYGYDPYYGRGRDIESYTVYNRRLEMDIVRTADNLRLFEGRVESDGADRRLPEVMPYLIDAMFSDFPGQSGVTKKVTVPVPEKSGGPQS